MLVQSIAAGMLFLGILVGARRIFYVVYALPVVCFDWLV